MAASGMQFQVASAIKDHLNGWSASFAEKASDLIPDFIPGAPISWSASRGAAWP